MKHSLLCLALLACGSTDANEVANPTPAQEEAPAQPEVVDEQLVANEWIGELKGHASTVTLAHGSGVYDIDAFEASLDADRAVSVPGANATVDITWYDARDACENVGKRLCSEEEWLIACTGAPPIDRDRDTRFSDDPIQGRAYPYGPTQVVENCASSRNGDDARPLITGNHPRCGTPEGVYDLEGVTKEWIGITPDRAAVKGGSYYSKGSARCAYFKDSIPPDSRHKSIGFRCCQGDPPDSAASPLPEGGRVGDLVKDFTLPALDGGEINIADLKGKPFIVTFWASYCGPCKQELPVLGALYNQYKDQGLTIIAVNVDTNMAAARKFLATTPIVFPVGLDDQTIRNRFGANTLPSTYFVTSEGRIRQRTVGYDQRFQRELEQNVADLMVAQPL